MIEKCAQTGKECHLSQNKAAAHLKHLQISFAYVGHVYFCKFCQCWHVGRQKKITHKNKYA